jgi:hypothetical protein
MTDDIQKDIVKLTEEWYELISSNHHKDKDCHWYIETRWSYGEKPEYRVLHNGYVTDDIEIACDSYETALTELRIILKRAIEREKELEKLPKHNDW